MDTFLEMQTALQGDLTIGAESSLFTPTLVKSSLNRAYRKAGGLFKWPMLKDAKKTSTQANEEYYDYPQTWQPDSIWKVTIDSVRYGEEPDGSPLTFEDYLNWKEDNPSSTDKKWTNFNKQFFVHPTPTTTGSFNISVWGYENVETMVDDDDITIFSYAKPEGNEAIVLEAKAILKNKGEEEKSGEFASAEAKQILVVMWDKIRKEQAKYEKIKPMLNVPDFFNRRGGNGQNTGNFDL